MPHPHDVSVQAFRGHSVLQTLIRAYFSPAHSTGQRYVYTGSADGSVRIYGGSAAFCLGFLLRCSCRRAHVNFALYVVSQGFLTGCEQHCWSTEPSVNCASENYKILQLYSAGVASAHRHVPGLTSRKIPKSQSSSEEGHILLASTWVYVHVPCS